MTRIAHCCCGALRAEVTGEPPRVRIPMKPAGYSELKAATHSDFKAATIPI